MRRTGEIVLTVIGAILYAFLTFAGGLLIWIQNNQDVLREMMEETEGMQEAGFSMAEFNEMLEGIGFGSWNLAIVAGLGVILGIVAIVFLKGNKKPKPAGIILLVVAVASLILLGIGTWITALPYAIAGVMALARKPKPETIEV